MGTIGLYKYFWDSWDRDNFLINLIWSIRMKLI